MAFGQGRSGGGRGRGGDKKAAEKGQGQRRTLFRRRKVCKFCADKIDDINYKDVKLLSGFVPERGKVLPRRISGTCAKHQRALRVAIVRARQLSSATMRNIRQNLFLSFAYNVAGIPLAAGVLYPFFGLLLSPVVAAAAMALSSVSVIANALRLRTIKIR